MLIKKGWIFVLVITFVLGIASCKEDDDPSGPTQEEIDQQLIEQYIADNDLTTTKTSTGLHYIIHAPGNDNHPELNSWIEGVYKGELLDGSDFTNGVQILETRLWQLIPGCQEGLSHIGEGGKIKLIIPSNLAYGDQEVNGQANAVLVFYFEIDLVFTE